VTYALRRSTQNCGGPKSGRPALSLLVPLDGSALARLALPLALELAALAHAELILLQAVAPSIDAYLRDYPATADPRRALHDQAQQAFDGFAGDGKPQSMQLTTAVGVGSPGAAIVAQSPTSRTGQGV